MASIHIPSQVSLLMFPSPKTPAPFLGLVLALTLALTPGPSLGPSYRIFRVNSMVQKSTSPVPGRQPGQVTFLLWLQFYFHGV